MIFDGNKFNKYGHVAIVSKVDKDEIEIIQQNVGASSRASYSLEFRNGKWKIVTSEVLGWLSKR